MAATTTATDATVGHYRTPEIKATIMKFCKPETGGFRPLNGDDFWYLPADNGNVRLRIPDDYESTILQGRTVHALLDIFDDSVMDMAVPWDATKNAPTVPIGTFKECRAYTLGADIDSIGNIVENPKVKQAVEEMATFLVRKLQAMGVEKFINCLYSGGGIYVLLHHSLCGNGHIDQEVMFRRVTSAYNRWLGDMEYEFFRHHPEFKGLVKVDQLNTQKRKFKCIFSIHKKLPFAVVPLDPNNITIDFEKARFPLKPEVIAEGQQWYKQPEVTNVDKFGEAMAPYLQEAQKELDERKDRTGCYRIGRRHKALPLDEFPPCMKNILQKAEPGRGPHRALAVLASFLYESGWSENSAFKLWQPLAAKCNVESRIFDVWFGRVLCPKCATIRKDSAGYPKTGLAGLGYCEWNELCRGAVWPGGYGKQPMIGITEDLPQMIKEALDGLQKYNDPPIIFQRGGALCWVQDTDEGIRIQDLTADMLRPIVAQAVNFVSREKDARGEIVIKKKKPPMDVVKATLAQQSYGTPALKGLITSPVLRPDGSVLLDPGYDSATGLYYHSDKPLAMPAIPARPTKEDAIAAARYLVEEVLWDFPFDGMKRMANTSRTNALAALISPIVRPMVDGKMPMALIDKPSPGTGATLLMDLISIVATGEESAKLSVPDNDEEWRKQITAWLRDGSSLICLDNIDADLKAPALSRALTTLIWRDRVLGKPDDAKYPQRATWFATGNNLTLGGDLPRRSYLIQMDAKVAHPWERKTNEFRHIDIVKWVVDHRAEILSKIMIMARAWAVAGRPHGDHTKILGGFEQFTNTLGGILSYANMGGFLDNMDTMYENLDVESEEWEQFWAAWYATFKDAPKTSTQIMIELRKDLSLMKDATPTEISEKIKYPGPGDSMKIGRILRKKVGRETKNGFKLTHIDIDTDRHTQGWKLKKKDGQTEW
jgi:hypothetical protein